MRHILLHAHRYGSTILADLRWVVILITLISILSLPTLVARADRAPIELALPPDLQDDSGSWRLVSSDASDTWQGNNFHGLESEYSPIYEGNTIGATYTQYNIQFTQDQPQTISSQLTGTCSWDWQDGAVPSEIISGTKYPFNMSVDANASGSTFLGGTVNGFIENSEGSGTVAFAQVYLDVSGQVLSGHQEASNSLTLSPGKEDGESRFVTLSCVVDIVTVKMVYLYQWKMSGCAATLTLPDDMEPNKEFTPQVTVLDLKNKPVTPESETWYYNGVESDRTMKWDGKAATVEYEYVCPDETRFRKVQANIPAAPSCSATIVLPDDMEANKEFSRAEVVDPQGKQVQPKDEKWLFNGAASAIPIKWDGKAATLKYTYVCPLDEQPDDASIKIPPAEKSSGWLVVVGGLAAVAAAGLAAVAAGTMLVLGSRKKAPDSPPPPKYILQVDRSIIEVRPKENQPLNIQAWRINKDGSVAPAPEASIQVVLPVPSAGLAVSPTTGLGILNCLFSVPQPTVCETLTVNIQAVAGVSKTQAQVTVKIVPLYELELEWHDPQKTKPEVNGKEIYAWARLTATPLPDAKTTPDMLAEMVKVSIKGPNSEVVDLKTAPPGLHPPFAQKGLLWIPIRATSLAQQNGNPTLSARFDEGDQHLEKSLVVELNKEVALGVWAQGKKQTDVVYVQQSDPPGWLFGDIVVYFHEPQNDEASVEAPFDCDIDNPEFTIDPDSILQIEDYHEERPGWYTGRVTLKDSVDLENYFGPDLEEANAQIHLNVLVTTKTRQKYVSSVTYQICPTVEMVAMSCDEESGEPIKEREYEEIELKPYELLADSKDMASLMIFFRRTDWPADAERYVKFGSITSMALQGSDPAEYKLGQDNKPFETVENTDGLYYTSVIAARPLLSKASRPPEKLGLQVEGNLVNQPYYYRLKKGSINQALKPLPLTLKMWVIPGQQRGTSIAAVAAEWPRQGQKFTLIDLTDLDYEFTVTCEGMSVAAEPVSRLTQVRGGGRIVNEDVPDWCKAWRLSYSGLDWENVTGASFTAHAGFSGSSDGEDFRVNIAQNGAAMISALNAAAGALDMTNREWQDSTLMWGLDVLIKRECRGFIYNLREMGYSFFYGAENCPEAYRRYVCGAYSQRLRCFLLDRRHGRQDPQTALAMNGMECCQYILEYAGFGVHDWCGIHLSGSTPVQNPIFIDPWHIQEWDSSFFQDNFGFKKQTAYLLLEVTFLISEAIVIGGYLARFLARYAPTLQPPPSTAEVMKFFMSKIREKIWPTLAILAGGGTWWASSASNNDAQCFDDNFNYSFYSEVELLQRLRDHWLNGMPGDSADQ